jgi:hypothetical protein
VAFPAALASDTFTVNVRVTSAPTGSVYRSQNAATGPDAENATISTAGLSHGVTATGNTVTGQITVTQSTSTGILQATSSNSDKLTVGALFTAGPAASVAGSASFLINVMPDVAGTYTVLVSTRCGQVAAVTTPARQRLRKLRFRFIQKLFKRPSRQPKECYGTKSGQRILAQRNK